MSKIIPTPKGVNIKPQRMDFEFNDVPTYWFDNEPVQTHLLNALSLTFPDGERFFVDSVRAFRHLARDKKHNKAISGFIGQEAMHSLEHDTFNQFLSQSGYQSQVEGGVKLDCSGGFGSATMVTATFAMVAAAKAVERYLNREQK